jgi:hypothetical protein
MTARKSLDKAILKVIGETPEITINNLMFKLDKGGLHEGKSKRAVANHVYDLRREGMITQLGQSNNVRYILTSQLEPVTEQARQNAEAQRREGTANTANNTGQSNGSTVTAPGQLGACDLIDLGTFYILEPRADQQPPAHKVEAIGRSHEQPVTAPEPAEPPASVIVLDSRQATEEPFGLRVDAIAQHIGTTVTLTVRQLIGEALREKDTTIKVQSQHIASLGQANEKLHDEKKADAEQIDKLQRDIAEQEQLYNELDTKYNTLRKTLAGLSA